MKSWVSQELGKDSHSWHRACAMAQWGESKWLEGGE